MNKNIRIATFLAALAMPLPAIAAPIHAIMYKNPSCSCCETYAGYLEKNGFEVEMKPSNDLTQISTAAGVPEQLQACHTIKVDGYVIDGFVPVGIVKKMLDERPAIAGISLPGMPMGSPGMGGTKTEPFTVYAFTTDGKAPTVYAVE
ncbi:CopG family transcriptional regulator [Phyllobacterium sp. LjRoot231]|uniref:DUF411 domain-containing protein n=1 Tax=Phyllobacterium sp. LjRoot231 TaxID=3342289 RepID=UPI003ECCD874